MLNYYNIKLSINNVVVDFKDKGYLEFSDMFEQVMGLLEQAFDACENITNVELTYKDKVIANDIDTLIKIGTAISNFSVKLEYDNNNFCYKHEIYFFIENILSLPRSESYKIYIVGSKGTVYNVFPTVGHFQIKKIFDEWGDIIDTAQKIVNDYDINPVLEEPIDMNWTMQYYVPAELKKALSLIDTNPEESKKILMVMDYMLSKGKQ